MFYRLKHIGRFEMNFLCVGAYDLDEIQKIGKIDEENIEISMDALICLNYMPNVKNIILTPGNVNPIDLEVLQGLRIKALKLDYYSYEIDNWNIDLSQFPFLEYVYARTQYCFRNVSQCKNLHTLSVLQWIDDNLEYLYGSTLKALELSGGPLKSLIGIHHLPQLRSLTLENLHRLSDISSLEGACLESLAVTSCNKLDANIFPCLPHLRLLILGGSKKISCISSILRQTPKLEWIYLEVDVEQGDLSPLKKLQHVVIFRDCRHYTLKNKDLPKADVAFCSNYIPNHLRILP